MIYITGDTHGEELRFLEGNMPGEQTWTQEDYLIVCGDFGYVFLDDAYERMFLDLLEKKPYTICFCDGNHENFDRLYQYPEEQWHGGKIHRVRKNIIHLMRGEIFEICGKKVFAMGGAYSIDKYMRKEGYSWWPQELPAPEEYRQAGQNLQKHNFQVDLVITHTAPTEVIRRMGYTPDDHDRELRGFLEWVMYETQYSQWFFGHWHEERKLPEYKMRGLWFDVIAVE